MFGITLVVLYAVICALSLTYMLLMCNFFSRSFSFTKSLCTICARLALLVSFMIAVFWTMLYIYARLAPRNTEMLH
jgi:hypothetical protein